MLPFKIRATAPLYFNDFAAGILSRHFPPVRRPAAVL